MGYERWETRERKRRRRRKRNDDDIKTEISICRWRRRVNTEHRAGTIVGKFPLLHFPLSSLFSWNIQLPIFSLGILSQMWMEAKFAFNQFPFFFNIPLFLSHLLRLILLLAELKANPFHVLLNTSFLMSRGWHSSFHFGLPEGYENRRQLNCPDRISLFLESLYSDKIVKI